MLPQCGGRSPYRFERNYIGGMIDVNKHRTGAGVPCPTARLGPAPYLLGNGDDVQLTSWRVDEKFDRGGGVSAKTHYSSGYELINGKAT